MFIDIMDNFLLIILGAISLGIILSLGLVLKTFLSEGIFSQDQDYNRYYQNTK